MPDNYGMFFKCWSKTEKRRIQMQAHRIAYELSIGPIPPGLHVCHSCDNPPCCNPHHLFLGSNRVNMHDRDAKGRGANRYGERNGRARLSWNQVQAIRDRYAIGNIGQRPLAREFGVSMSQIGRIVHYEAWTTDDP